MPKTPLSPDSVTLRGFLLGTLPQHETETVQEWIEANPDAADTLNHIDATDHITRAIAAPAPTDSCPESVVDAIVRTLTQHGPPSWVDDTELDIPTTIGKHRILRVIGRGGMGVVLEGVDNLGRRVAIKFIAPRYATDPAILARFRREAEAVAALDQGNVVPVFEYGEEGGRPYFVMPLLSGETLETRLKREGPLPASEVRRIGREVAAGLAAAHSKGVIHRDIKPSNIWLDADADRARLLDFGLAKPVAETEVEKGLTRTGAVMGTARYMSPEQAQGQTLDERTDLFSLGAVLYEAATGRRPFDGPTTAALLLAVVKDDPPAPESVNSALPPRLSAIIRSLLAKNPAHRPASAAAVMKTLAQPDDPPRQRSVLPWWVLAASVLFVCGATAATYQLVFATKDGELVVQVSGDADVRFSKGELHIYGPDGKLKYTLRPGERNAKVAPGRYTVKVGGADGVELDTDEFTMTKDGKVIIRVTAKPKDTPKPDVTADPDRKAAEYVLSVGGTVRVNGELRDRRQLTELPKEPFRLTGVWLGDSDRVTEAGLAVFDKCQDIEWLNLGSGIQPGVEWATDAALAHFRNCTKLETVTLTRTRITNAGLAHLKGCTRLRRIDVHITQIGNEGLAHLNDCSELEQVGLSYTKVTDGAFYTIRRWKKLVQLDLTWTPVTAAELALLKDHTSLRYLGLGRTQVTDKELTVVEGFSQLREVRLEHSKVTPAGVKSLAEKLPYCRIEHTGGVLEPKGWLDRWYAEFVLSVGGGVRVNDEERERRTIAELPKESFRLTWAKISRSPRAIDDNLLYTGCESLKYLDLSGTIFSEGGAGWVATCKNLEYLNISKSNIGEARLEAIKTALPKCKIVWDGGVIEPRTK